MMTAHNDTPENSGHHNPENLNQADSADIYPVITPEPGSLLELILAQLDDDQAQDVVTISLKGKSSIADYMVVASGRSTRQVASMAHKLADKIKQAGFGPSRLEGLTNADWVLIDAADVVVHLFRPEVRSFYNLERMWAFGDGFPKSISNA